MSQGPRNPWGQNNGNDNRGRQGPWGNNGGQGGGPEDMDEMLRRARAQLGGMIPGNFGGGTIIGLGILVILALWLSSGLYFVNPGENAVITRFGAWERTQQVPGIGYHAPWPIENAVKLNVTQDRRIQIGFAETFSRNGASGKRDIAEESLMLTSDANIVDLDLVIFWNIEKAEDFLFNIHDPIVTLKKVGESAIREVVGQTELQPIITEQREEVANKAEAIIQDTLDNYGSGISIKQVLIQDATVHPEVIPAFDDVVAAIQDAETFQNEATIYRNDVINQARGQSRQIVLEAEGYRDAVIARASGDADRFNKIYESYKTGEDVTRRRIYLETMEKILVNANKVIVDQDGGNGIVPYLPLNELGRNSKNKGN